GGGAKRDKATRHFVGELPEDGSGSLATLTMLLTHGMEAATNSAGPRFFHFVTGGSTPAALAADWLASALDNNAGVWISAPLGSPKWGANESFLQALERELKSLNGAPAIVVATAGEVNAGGFDPIATMADLAHAHHAWLHVDGAFGLFARVSPVTADLAEGVELADSVIADGHKWLNVPYDCGFAFARDARLLNAVFGIGAPYFPTSEADHPDFL